MSEPKKILNFPEIEPDELDYVLVVKVDGTHTKVKVGDFLNSTLTEDRFLDMEAKGLLPKRNNQESPIEDRIPNFVSKYRLKRQDVTIVMLDGSISADNGYASKRTNQAYQPPCFTDNNLPGHIEDRLRWKEQQFRRYDAFKVEGGDDSVFSETGTAVTTSTNAAWDWQGELPGYNGLTRILTGVNPAVSYEFPAQNRRCDFIYRTDYLSSDSLIVSVTPGTVEAYNELTETWVEANGFVFTAQEANTLIPSVYRSATTLRKTVYQKRLKMRKVEVDIATARTVHITSQDGGRLCYWGISYSPKEYMFQFVNNSRASHTIADLRHFEEWAVDDWQPDLILFSCNTINEAATVATTSTPVEFAARFEDFIDDLLVKDYTPEMFCYTVFTNRNSGIVDVNDKIGTHYVSGYGECSVFDYIDDLNQTLKSKEIASVNIFNEFWTLAKLRATFYETTIYAGVLTGSGAGGDTFLTDSNHLNDYGAMIGWRFLEKYFNF